MMMMMGMPLMYLVIIVKDFDTVHQEQCPDTIIRQQAILLAKPSRGGWCSSSQFVVECTTD
jgi:hypothetical protein